MVRSYSRQELENIFTERYKGKICSFNYPGKDSEEGLVKDVAFDHNGHLILSLAGRRHSVSLESVNQVVKVIRH